MNTQFELRTTVSDETAELLDDYFFEIESIHWGIMQKNPQDPYEVFGIFPDADSAYVALAKLRNDFPNLTEKFTETVIKDSDWQNAYKAFVKPWNDRCLHWVPVWERDHYTVPSESTVVYLDAGMAFGTGAHETTQLCARRLLDYYHAHIDQLETLKVIDTGCGSGVLAFSAAALGFKQVLGFDFDPDAIAVCHKNASENPHIAAVAFEVANLENGLKHRQADLLLANIQTDVLIPFSTLITKAIKSRGTLVLSGILTKELEHLRDHYKTEFAMLRPESSLSIDSRRQGEWSDLLLTVT